MCGVCKRYPGYAYLTPMRPADVLLYLFSARDTLSVSGNIGHVIRQELSSRIILTVFNSWEACSSSGGWLPVQTRVYLSPLQERKGLFLAAMHWIHTALPGFWHTGPVYVWFTCLRCQILAALPHLPGTCDFPHALTGGKVAKQKKFSSAYQLANIQILCPG